MGGITIPEEQMSNFVSQAIMQSLDEKTRNEMITSAIQNLLTVQPTTQYGSKNKSLLIEAFERAAQQECLRIVREQMETNEKFQDALGKVIGDAFNLWVEKEDKSELSRKISWLISETLFTER